MRYAIIENGLVVNVIVADAGFIAAHVAAPKTAVAVDGIQCGPGWTYSNGTFTPPDPE